MQHCPKGNSSPACSSALRATAGLHAALPLGNDVAQSRIGDTSSAVIAVVQKGIKRRLLKACRAVMITSSSRPVFSYSRRHRCLLWREVMWCTRCPTVTPNTMIANRTHTSGRTAFHLHNVGVPLVLQHVTRVLGSTHLRLLLLCKLDCRKGIGPSQLHVWVLLPFNASSCKSHAASNNDHACNMNSDSR